LNLRKLCRRGLWLAVYAICVTGFAVLAGCGGGGGGDSSSPGTGSGSGSGSGATLQSIAVTPAQPQIASAASEQFAATGTYSDGSHQDLTTQVTWASSQTAVATIASGGKATAIAAGTTTITATSGSTQGHATLTVTAALVSIAITPQTSSVAAGTPQPFTATGTFADNSKHDVTTTVTWASDNASVATISNTSPHNGLATTLTAGMAHITASLGAIKSPAATLTVIPALVSIAVTPLNPNLAPAGSVQFTATGTYSDNSTQNLTTTVTWHSADTTIAKVSNNANSQGFAAATTTPGSTAITAKLGSISGGSTLTVTPATYAYVTNYLDNTVSQFVIGANGVLTPQATTTVSTETAPSSIGVDPFGRYAYVANSSSQTLFVYTIKADGTLSLLANHSSVATGNDPRSVTVDPQGQYVYVANISDTPADVSGFNIGTNPPGALTAMPTSPFPAAADPYCVTVDPSDQFVYVVDDFADVISQYTIGAGGTLTPMNSAVVDVGNSPYAIVVAPNDQYAYLTNSADNDVQVLAIGAGGGLTPGTTFATGMGPRALAISPNGLYVYVVNYTDGTISQFTTNADGSLSVMSPATVAAGSQPVSIAFDPSGTYVYVANSDDYTVSQYAVGAGGVLTPLTPATIATGSAPSSIATAP